MQVGDVVSWIVPEVIIKSYDYKTHILELSPYTLTKKAIQQDIKLSSVIVVSANLLGFPWMDYSKEDGILTEEDGIEYYKTLDSREGLWIFNRIVSKYPVLTHKKAFPRIAHPLNHILKQIKAQHVYEVEHLKGQIFDIKNDDDVMIQSFYGQIYYIKSRYLQVVT